MIRREDLPILLTLLALTALALPSLAQERDNAERIAALSAADPTARAMAACELGRGRAADVRPARGALLALIGDDAPVERKLCRDWEGWRGRDESSSPGREAAIALEELGTDVLPELIALLEDARPAAREQAALALGLIESERSIEPLARVLQDRESAVRARAAWSLGMIERSGGVEPLRRAITDPSEEVRAQVAWALGMIESAEGVEPLARLAGDSSARVREQAAWGLGMIESRAGVAPLLPLLEDPEPEVREQAAWGLGMIEDVRAAEAIADALERETDNGVRKQLIWALTRVIDDAAFDLDPGRLADLLRRALLDGRI